MGKLVKFENCGIDVQNIDGVWMFELYSVGMALGHVKKNSKGVIYPAKDRIDKNAENAEIKPCVHNAHKYLTESQVYDLMLEARTEKCRAFRKWLTNEVLPELNHNGTYTMKDPEPKQLEIYEYFAKTYKGEPVLSSVDVAELTGRNRATIDWFIRQHLVENHDYYLLKSSELSAFKKENPKVNSVISSLYLITKKGFELICAAYGIKYNETSLFITENNSPAKNTKPKQEYGLIRSSQYHQEIIEKIKKNMTAIDVLIFQMNKHNVRIEEFDFMMKTLVKLGEETETDITRFAALKIPATTEYKY